MKEIWKDIEGYEGLYQISNFGRVKSLPKKNGNSYQEERILKPKNNQGYMQVNLYKNKKCKSIVIHRMVAKAFIKNEYNKREVNHIDGNKANNRVDNLEWCTPSENQKHAYRIGLKGRRKEKIK